MDLLEELKAHFDYNPDTGHFIYKTTKNKRVAGNRAGFQKDSGYRVITVQGKQQLEHRMAWLFMTGHLPVNEIDHINRTHDDNRFCNLRDVTRKQNASNVVQFRTALNIK